MKQHHWVGEPCPEARPLFRDLLPPLRAPCFLPNCDDDAGGVPSMLLGPKKHARKVNGSHLIFLSISCLRGKSSFTKLQRLQLISLQISKEVQGSFSLLECSSYDITFAIGISIGRGFGPANT